MKTYKYTYPVKGGDLEILACIPSDSEMKEYLETIKMFDIELDETVPEIVLKIKATSDNEAEKQRNICMDAFNNILVSLNKEVKNYNNGLKDSMIRLINERRQKLKEKRTTDELKSK